MNQFLTYEMKNLEDTRNFLVAVSEQVILTNNLSAIRCYGIIVIDYMFKTLLTEFPSKIIKIIINVGDNHPALFTAKKFNYDNIIYTGNSLEAIKIMAKRTVIASDRRSRGNLFQLTS